MSDRKMSYARRKTGFVIAPRKESRENMTLEELIEEVPALVPYFEHMPEELHNRYTIRVYPPGTIIHQKDYKLEKFGIIAKGEHRVINEFQNGNVFMIEKNEPIDFVGEVTILAGDNRCLFSPERLRGLDCQRHSASAAGRPQNCIQAVPLLL